MGAQSVGVDVRGKRETGTDPIQYLQWGWLHQSTFPMSAGVSTIGV